MLQLNRSRGGTLHIHPFEGATEGEEIERRERLGTKWAAMEAIVGTEKRLRTVAKDLEKHFEERLEAMDGKAMVVCMSCRICIDLYNEIVKLRPDWHNGNDKAGVLKIVMTGSATDGPEWQQHIRDKRPREALGKRFKAARETPSQIREGVEDNFLPGLFYCCYVKNRGPLLSRVP